MNSHKLPTGNVDTFTGQSCALPKLNSPIVWTAQDIAGINASWAGTRAAVYFLTNRPIHANLWARVAVKFARKATG